MVSLLRSLDGSWVPLEISTPFACVVTAEAAILGASSCATSTVGSSSWSRSGCAKWRSTCCAPKPVLQKEEVRSPAECQTARRSPRHLTMGQVPRTAFVEARRLAKAAARPPSSTPLRSPACSCEPMRMAQRRAILATDDEGDDQERIAPRGDPRPDRNPPWRRADSNAGHGLSACVRREGDDDDRDNKPRERDGRWLSQETGSAGDAGDAGPCPVLSSQYDQSCTRDSDCLNVGEVLSCPAGICSLFCETGVINKQAEAPTWRPSPPRARQASTRTPIPCNCGAEGLPCCRTGLCRQCD